MPQNRKLHRCNEGGGKLKVKVKHDFRDKQQNMKLQRQNSTLNLKEDRAKKLISLGLVEKIEEEKENSKNAAG